MLAASRFTPFLAAATMTHLTATMLVVQALPQAPGNTNDITTSAAISTSTTTSSTLTGQPAINTNANITRLTKADPKLIAIVSISTISFCILIGLTGYFIRYPPSHCRRRRQAEEDEWDSDDDEHNNENGGSQKGNMNKQHASEPTRVADVR